MNEQVTHNLDMLQALVHSEIKSSYCIGLIAKRIKIAQEHIGMYSRYNNAYCQNAAASIQQRLNQITSGKV